MNKIVEFLNTPVIGGNTWLNFIEFTAILIATYAVWKIVNWLFSDYFRSLVKKTRTDLDDLILDAVRGPAKWAVALVGFLFALKSLTFGSKLGHYVNLTVFALTILLGAFALSKVVTILMARFVESLKRRNEGVVDDSAMIAIRKIINATIWVLAGLLVLSNYGINVSSLIAGLGIGGLAVALAAKETLSNMFGGVIIFVDRPFKIGDVIEFEGEFGVVEEIGLRSARIRTLSGFLLTIPNSKFIEAGIKNLSNGQSRRVEMTIGVVYDTSAEELEKAKEIIREALKETPGVLQDREPVIYFDDFADSSLNIKVYYWTVFDWNAHVEVKDRVNMIIKRRFDEEGIGFAFPTMTLDIPRLPIASGT